MDEIQRHRRTEQIASDDSLRKGKFSLNYECALLIKNEFKIFFNLGHFVLFLVSMRLHIFISSVENTVYFSLYIVLYKYNYIPSKISIIIFHG